MVLNVMPVVLKVQLKIGVQKKISWILMKTNVFWTAEKELLSVIRSYTVSHAGTPLMPFMLINELFYHIY